MKTNILEVLQEETGSKVLLYWTRLRYRVQQEEASNKV